MLELFNAAEKKKNGRYFFGLAFPFFLAAILHSSEQLAFMYGGFLPIDYILCLLGLCSYP